MVGDVAGVKAPPMSFPSFNRPTAYRCRGFTCSLERGRHIARRGGAIVYGRSWLEVADHIEAHHSVGVDEPWAVLPVEPLPHIPFPVVGVTGSSGKSSTCAMIDAALRAAGRRVVSFYDVQWHLDGVIVSAPVTSVERHRYLHFALAAFAFDVDIAVVELSALPLADELPLTVGAVTAVFPDHMDVLGPTLIDVVRRKARVVGTAPTVIAGPMAADLRTALACELPACRVVDAHPSTAFITPLLGAHQAANQAVAMAALAAVGIDHPDFADTRLGGRIQHVADGLIVDLVKNGVGAQAFARYLTEMGWSGPVCVTGRYGDSLGPLLAAFAPVATRFDFFAPPGTDAYPCRPWTPHEVEWARRLRPTSLVRRVVPPAAVVGPFNAGML